MSELKLSREQQIEKLEYYAQRMFDDYFVHFRNTSQETLNKYFNLASPDVILFLIKHYKGEQTNEG